MNLKALIFILLYSLPVALCSQNVVVEVNGTVIEHGQGTYPLKKGDNVYNTAHLDFIPDTRVRNPDIKLLTPKGMCFIRLGDYQAHKESVLSALVDATIRRNPVGVTLGAKGIRINPTSDRQVQMVDSLCARLNANAGNIEHILSLYINPFCIFEFPKPYWKPIADMLCHKYGLSLHQPIGNLMTTTEYDRIPKMARASAKGILPPSYSLKQYCPTPGYQGDYGTCVGWASAYGIRTISWAIRNNDTITGDINNQTFSPTYIYEQIKESGDDNCQRGASILNAADLLKHKGVPFFSDLTAGCNLDITPFNEEAANYVIKDYYALTGQFGLAGSDDSFNENLHNIQQAIAAKRPVLASIRAFNSFSYGTVWSGDLDVYRGNHALCIIGYDNNFAGGEGGVEVMNSWGTWWGTDGFMYIKYRDLKNILLGAIAVYDDIKPAPVQPVKVDTLQHLEGSLRLVLDNGALMPFHADEDGVNGLSLTTDDHMTYEATTAYPANTSFKITLSSSQPGYVYVVGTDAKRSPLVPLFPIPNGNTTALLDFATTASITIPDGYYISMDDQAVDDYLCIIFSKAALDISGLQSTLDHNSAISFVQAVKASLANAIVDNGDITFEKDQIAFKAASLHKTAVPIFIKIRHS